MRNNSDSKKLLVVYFSHTGNTRKIAELLHEKTGGDIIEIETVDKYPADHGKTLDQTRKEISSGFKPALKTKMENIDEYNFVFLGYPNWWGTIPSPISSFLSENNLSGKTIAPFCTHGSGGLSGTTEAVKKSCPDSKVLDALGIKNSDVGDAAEKVSQWLSGINII